VIDPAVPPKHVLSTCVFDATKAAASSDIVTVSVDVHPPVDPFASVTTTV
jgi:hypothetical protein